MKRILSILLSVISLAAFAQKATVERVELTNNIAASKYPMTDLNGRTAALVIVQVLADNVEFTGSVLNGGVVRKTGEYWVYMGVGAKELHIHSDKFLPVEIRFPDYGIPRLESAATYAVTLSLPQAAPQSAAAGYSYLVLNVSPANAQVTIDGKTVDVQGGVAKRLLRSGATYPYSVEAPGYLPEQGTVAIGSERVTRSVTLRSTKGTLSVATTTPGTEIYVNGDRMGAGSWTGELAPDNYLVEGRLSGHRATDMMVSIATGETRTVTLPALAPVTGSLNVDYSPAGASVALDGKALGTTPDVFDGIPVGTHSVTVSASGFRPATLSATVTESALTTLQGALTPQDSYETVSYLPFVDSNTKKWGFKDADGNIVIPATYEKVWEFSEGLAPVQIRDKTAAYKWGFIDKDNKFVIPATYVDARPFSEGLAPVDTDVYWGGWGFIDKDNKMIIPAVYDGVTRFTEGLAGVAKDGKCGHIDKNNRFVIPPSYEGVAGFCDGLARVIIKEKAGFIDRNNRIVIPAKYREAWWFTKGICPVNVRGKWGFIDRNNNFVVAATHSSTDFFEGMSPRELDGKWGYVDEYNTLIIPAIYEDADWSFDGRARVKINGKWGYIDRSNQMMIPAVYDSAGRFENGKAQVTLNGRTFYIDRNGNEAQ